MSGGGPDLTQIGLEFVHSPNEPTTVDLELGLARPSGADAAALLRQLLARSPQPRQAVTQLGEFDLGLAFERARVLRKNVKNHGGAVEGRSSEDFFEIELLRRCELVVEDDSVAIHSFGNFLDLLGLARADECRRVR